MKARIIQEPRCVLLWRFDEKSAGYDALAHAARAYKLKIRCIGDGDLAAKVGDLCQGLPSPAFAPFIKVSDRPAMIVSGLRHDTGELGHFKIKKEQSSSAGVRRIKAVLEGQEE